MNNEIGRNTQLYNNNDILFGATAVPLYLRPSYLRAFFLCFVAIAFRVCVCLAAGLTTGRARAQQSAEIYIVMKETRSTVIPSPSQNKTKFEEKKKQREKDQIENEGICVAHAPSHANGQNLAWFSLTISNSMRAKISIDSNWCESKNKK